MRMMPSKVNSVGIRSVRLSGYLFSVALLILQQSRISGIEQSRDALIPKVIKPSINGIARIIAYIIGGTVARRRGIGDRA